MPSSRKVGTNENISTYGAGGFGRDYTVLATWESATDTNLVSATQSEVLECYDDQASFSDRIVMAGATTNASYFRIIRPAGTKFQSDWQGHDGTPNNGFRIESIIDNFQIMRIDEDYGQHQDIILAYNLSTANDLEMGVLDDGATETAFVGIICDESSNAGAGLFRGFESQADTGEKHFFINIMILGVDDFGIQVDDKDGDVFAFNCTIRSCDNGFVKVSGGTGSLTCKNCLSDNNATADYVGTIGGNNNASSDATAPGTGPRINQTFTFFNAAGGDIHLGIDDAGALDFGADLSADGDYAFDDDIDFRPRITAWTWDIGADEYFSPYPIISDIESRSLVFGNRIVR